MRKARLVLALIPFLMTLQGAVAGGQSHIKASLASVNGSNVSGHVSLVQLPHGGTLISVVATGLRPDGAYLSLYYDNDVCEIEPYSEDDIVGTYTGNRAGIGTAISKAADDLDEIGSVSVRNAEDFSLLACATLR